MVSEIFCALHKKAIDNFKKGLKSVSVNELDLVYLKRRFQESLDNLNISFNK